MKLPPFNKNFQISDIPVGHPALLSQMIAWVGIYSKSTWNIQMTWFLALAFHLGSVDNPHFSAYLSEILAVDFLFRVYEKDAFLPQYAFTSTDK